MLERYGLSKKKYKKITKYKKPSQIVEFVNTNKNKIKKVSSKLSSITQFFDVFFTVVELSSILTKSKSASLAVAEIMFYGLIRVLGFAGSRLIEFIVTKVITVATLVKYVIREILEQALEWFLESKMVAKIQKNYLSCIDVKKFTFKNCMIALFKGTMKTFA